MNQSEHIIDTRDLEIRKLLWRHWAEEDARDAEAARYKYEWRNGDLVMVPLRHGGSPSEGGQQECLV